MVEFSYPKLRQVDMFPAEVSGEKVICLRDPLNLSGKILFIPYPTFFIVSLFDGQHSLADIQVEFMRRFGELLYKEKIQTLIDQLEEHFLLESERFRQSERKIVEEFQRNPVRSMALEGETYEGGAEELQKAIAAYFLEPEGPGLPLSVNGHQTDESGKIVGAIAPHIDYQRGGACYAWAHKAIWEHSQPDLFIILGTSHSPTKQPFVLTRKDFQTPWGVVETDRAFLDEIETRVPGNLYEDEFVHKGEHSIELQVTFLHALGQKGNPFQIVPVLCGSFHGAIQGDVSPMDLEGVRPFIEALRAAIGQTRKSVCLLASADLAHVGMRFGDAEGPNRFSLQTLRDDDRHSLEYVERLDAEGFYDSLRREKDRRRICGLPPIYTLLHLIEAREGKLLKYSQSIDPATQSAVTFASMAFFR